MPATSCQRMALGLVLGVWVAARPYLRNGLEPLILAAPRDQAAYAVDETYSAEIEKAQNQARPGVTRDIWTDASWRSASQ